MDLRNQEELLKKKEKLEAYLLENPKTELFGWYARQNMEAGELDRALKICRLGLESVESRGLLYKLMGEIFLAKGDVTRSMQHFVECILTREPFPGVIIEVLKNLGNTMEMEQRAFLLKLLNDTIPGHPEAVRFFKKHPEAMSVAANGSQFEGLQRLATSLQQSAMVEVITEDEPADTETELIESTAEASSAATETPTEPESEPLVEKAAEKEPQPVKAEEKPPIEIPKRQPIPPAPNPWQERPKRKLTHPQEKQVKHNITRSMATFTLLHIFKSQGMYENALEVLQLLKEKSSNPERIQQEEKEIRELMSQS